MTENDGSCDAGGGDDIINDSNGNTITQHTTTTNNTSLIENTIVPPLSKNQQRKLRRRLIWEQTKDVRNQKRKQKRAEKRQREAKQREIAPPPPKPQITTPPNLHIIIDCSFDDLMTDGELRSLSKQLARCHSINKVYNITWSLYNLSPKLETELSKNNYKNWNNLSLTDQLSGIYLTADSNDVIYDTNELTLIIGGIVDKNRYKNLCLEKAKEMGLKTGKLPIGEFVKLESRAVLCVNHVFEILLQQTQLGWKDALMEVIPSRKVVVAEEEQDAKNEIKESTNQL